MTQKGALSEHAEERARLTRAMQPAIAVLGGRSFVLLYNDATGGTGILSNIPDPDEVKAVIVEVARMVATQTHDDVSTMGPDGETRRA